MLYLTKLLRNKGQRERGYPILVEYGQIQTKMQK